MRRHLFLVSRNLRSHRNGESLRLKIRLAQTRHQCPRPMLHGRVRQQAHHICLLEKLGLEKLLAERERHKDWRHPLLHLRETRRLERDRSEEARVL
jgi:hypothetical protein